MDHITDRKEVREILDMTKNADILVGIPSYNNANTICHVVKAVQTGLAKYFYDKKAVLVNSDGGSKDGTMDLVNGTTVDDFGAFLLSHRIEPLKITTPYHGIPGKGSAFRTIFEIAAALDVKACAVVDSDLRSITPEWIELLLKPIVSGNYDYVAPLYHRHKYDGTITNSIIYPVTRALYGKRVRQPIGGEFGFSGDLAKFYLNKNVWDTDVARYGIDIWMTTSAICNGFRVCQSFLGAKIHDPKDPSADLSAMLYQVVGSTFDLMESYYDVWRNVKSSESVPNMGFVYDVGLEPIKVNIERMVEKFRLGVRELNSIWSEFLPQQLVEFLLKLAKSPVKEFSLPDDIWVDIVYGFAVAVHKKALTKEHILKSLTPLYIGRTASFVISTWESDARDVEEKIENLCKIFEEKKPSLIERWDGEGGSNNGNP